MKIIDAHLHLFSTESPRIEEMAQAVGHHNSTAHLRQVYEELGIVYMENQHWLRKGTAFLRRKFLPNRRQHQ